MDKTKGLLGFGNDDAQKAAAASRQKEQDALAKAKAKKDAQDALLEKQRIAGFRNRGNGGNGGGSVLGLGSSAKSSTLG